jgi:hypothetical protein
MVAVSAHVFEEVQMFQRVLTASVVAILLVVAPMGLAAQEREVRAAEQAPVLEWLSGLWSDVAAWLAPPLDSAGDGRCAVDPDGCPSGAAAPAPPQPSSFRDGTCSLDPDGCPGGQ